MVLYVDGALKVWFQRQIYPYGSTHCMCVHRSQIVFSVLSREGHQTRLPPFSNFICFVTGTLSSSSQTEPFNFSYTYIKHHTSYLIYSDDIILYFSDVNNAVPQALALFERFDSFSGYKINWCKSILMPLDSNRPKLNLPVSSPIHIHTSPICKDKFTGSTTCRYHSKKLVSTIESNNKLEWKYGNSPV